MRITPDEFAEMNVEIERCLLESGATMRASGFPEQWIAKPDNRQPENNPALPHRRNMYLSRVHRRGHGWKANHEA